MAVHSDCSPCTRIKDLSVSYRGPTVVRIGEQNLVRRFRGNDKEVGEEMGGTRLFGQAKGFDRYSVNKYGRNIEIWCEEFFFKLTRAENSATWFLLVMQN